MKKLLLVLFIIPLLAIAQNKPDWEYDFNRPIGAFFPSYFPMATNKYMATQNTYYEYNWVSNNLQHLIENGLKLRRSSNDVTTDNYIINSYSTGAGTVIDRIKIKYNIFTIYGLYVVSSVEITGSKIQVAKLFIYLYNNEIQSGGLKNGFLKTFAQDNAVYSQVNGIASIKISNVVYKNQTQFKTDFDKKKEKFKTDLMLEKAAEEQQRIEYEEGIKKDKAQFTADSIARKKENEAAYSDFKKRQDARPKTAVNVYYFKKSSSKLEFGNQPNPELERQIIEKANGYKKGKYSAYVVTTTILDVSTYEIKINPTDKEFRTNQTQ